MSGSPTKSNKETISLEDQIKNLLKEKAIKEQIILENEKLINDLIVNSGANIIIDQKKQIQELKLENEQLKDKITKLEYRINKQNLKIKEQQIKIDSTNNELKLFKEQHKVEIGQLHNDLTRNSLQHKVEIDQLHNDLTRNSLQHQKEIDQLNNKLNKFQEVMESFKNIYDCEAYKSLQLSALDNGFIKFTTVFQYYLQHHLMKEAVKNLGINMDWEEFKESYQDNRFQALAIGVDLYQLKTFIKHRNQMVHVDKKDDIIKIIYQIKKSYSALADPDRSFYKVKDSFLHICRLITDDQNFTLD